MNIRILAAAIAIAATAPAARAQFGSGIVFDPTQSGHAVQQILQGKQLYTTTVETTQNVITAYNLAQRMASLPQTLYSTYSNLGSQAWTMLTQPANTYGNSLPWINAASSGYGAAPANQAASLPSHWADVRLFLSQCARAAGHSGTRGDGGSFRRCQCQQSASGRNGPPECGPTRGGH